MQGLHGLKDCTIVCKNLLQTQIGKIFEKKYVKLVLSQNVEGIFNSKVSDFRVLNPRSFWDLRHLVPPGLCLGPIRRHLNPLSPPKKTLLKLVSQKNL